MVQQRITDDEWFEAQFDWKATRKRLGIPLPSLPSDDVQTGFTALSGRQNLLQAFGFYKTALKYIEDIDQPRILDFGCGWGRLSRFFLRETDPKNIYLADAMDNAIKALKATENPCNIIYNRKMPPIAGLPGELDLIYAYSVFSHISEEYFRVWIDYFLHMLKPGGHVVFTTRGWYFIEHLQTLRDGIDGLPKNLIGYVQMLCRDMPAPVRIARLYSEGQFLWYPIAGSDELTDDFWGEAFIPKQYLEERYGPMLVEFNEDVPHVDQTIVVLQKPR